MATTATFTNLLSSDCYVSDEFGTVLKFTAGQTRAGVSGYLMRYTSTYMTSPLLLLVGSAPDTLIGAVRNENMVFQPGESDNPTKVLTADLDPDDVSIAAPARRKRVVLNTENDTVGRQILTKFVGLRVTSGAPATTQEGMFIDPSDGTLYVVYGTTLYTYAATS